MPTSKSPRRQRQSEREKRVVQAVLGNPQLMAEIRQSLEDERQGKGVPSSALKRKNARR